MKAIESWKQKSKGKEGVELEKFDKGAKKVKHRFDTKNKKISKKGGLNRKKKK